MQLRYIFVPFLFSFSFSLLAMVLQQEQILQLLVAQENNGPVNSICYTTDGKQVLFGGENNPNSTIKICDTQDLSKIKSEISIDRIIKKLSSTNQAVAAANWNQVNVWDLATCKNIFKCESAQDCANTVAYNKDGTLLLAACFDGMARIYDTKIKKCAMELNADADEMNDAQWSLDNFQVATCSEKNHILNMWDIRTKRKVAYIEQPNENYLLQYHPVKNNIVSAGSEKILLYDTQYFTLLAAYNAKGHKVDLLEQEASETKLPTVNSLVFHPTNHNMLIAGLDNASVTFCNIEEPAQSQCIDTNKSIETIAVDPSGEYLAAGSFSSMDATFYKINIQMKDRAALMKPVPSSKSLCTLY